MVAVGTTIADRPPRAPTLASHASRRAAMTAPKQQQHRQQQHQLQHKFSTSAARQLQHEISFAAQQQHRKRQTNTRLTG